MNNVDVLDLSYPKPHPEPDRMDMFDYASAPHFDRISYSGFNDAFGVPPLLALAPVGLLGAPNDNSGVSRGLPLAAPLAPLGYIKSEWDDDDTLAQLPQARGVGLRRERPRTKSAHNVIEQRYRNKINDKFTALQNAVPTLRVIARKKPRVRLDDDEDEDEYYELPLLEREEDLEGLEPARKLNKGTILAKSVEYIKFLERKNNRMKVEHQHLVERARVLGVALDEEE